MKDFTQLGRLNNEVILLSPLLFRTNPQDKIAKIMDRLRTGAHIAMPKSTYSIEIQNEKLKGIMNDVFVLGSYGICDNYDEIRAKTDCDIYVFGYDSAELKMLGKSRPVKMAINYNNDELIKINHKNKKNFLEDSIMKFFNRKPTLDEAITKNKHELHNNTITIEQAIDVYESLIIDFPKDVGTLNREIGVLKDQQANIKLKEQEIKQRGYEADLRESLRELDDIIMQNTGKINKYSRILATRTDIDSFDYQQIRNDVAVMFKELEQAEKARKIFIDKLKGLTINPGSNGGRLGNVLGKGIKAAKGIAISAAQNGESTQQVTDDWNELESMTAPNHGRTIADIMIDGEGVSVRPVDERIDFAEEEINNSVDALIERAKAAQNAEDALDNKQTRDFLAEVRASKKSIELQTSGT